MDLQCFSRSIWILQWALPCPSRSEGRIPGGLIAGAGPRIGSGPCRRELDGGLWSSWPNFVILLYIFKESLKMKAERVAFCGFET